MKRRERVKKGGKEGEGGMEGRNWRQGMLNEAWPLLHTPLVPLSLTCSLEGGNVLRSRGKVGHSLHELHPRLLILLEH